MAKTIGIKLFTGQRAVNRFFKRLNMTLHEACDEYFYADRKNDLTELPEWLFERFRFHEVSLKVPDSVTIELHRTYLTLGNGDTRAYHKTAINVPYCGSKLLLQTSPVQGFSFPFVGQTGKKSFRVMQLRDDLNPTEFVANATAELDRVRDALRGSHKMVRGFNDQVQAEIERKMRTY